MNKAELSERIAERVGLLKSKIDDALDAFIEITIETLKSGGEVTLTGFGTFSARQRKGREGINPRNPQQKIIIPSVITAKFKAGKNLKDALKGKEPTPKVQKPAESAPKAEAAPVMEQKEAMPPVEPEKPIEAAPEIPIETTESQN